MCTSGCVHPSLGKPFIKWCTYSCGEIDLRYEQNDMKINSVVSPLNNNPNELSLQHRFNIIVQPVYALILHTITTMTVTVFELLIQGLWRRKGYGRNCGLILVEYPMEVEGTCDIVLGHLTGFNSGRMVYSCSNQWYHDSHKSRSAAFRTSTSLLGKAH